MIDTNWHECKDKGAWCRMPVCNTGCLVYALGLTEPNYPMPAIRWYVAWNKEKDKLITLRWYT